MRYALPGFVAAGAVALIVALVLAPGLAHWFADTLGAGAGHAHGGYWYGEYGQLHERAWPVGSLWLTLAFVGFAVLGAGVMALAWVLSMAGEPPPPDPKAQRRRKAQALIESVNRRGDLSTGEKEGFRSSALVLADADDATSIRAAELVGAGDAVTAAQGLAREAESDFLQLLRHAANIALPFSDRTSRRITRQRNRFERVDELARCCEDPDTLARKGGKRGDGEDGANGDHARLDVAWD
ncbi:hypothetical protein AAG607_14955 [Citromicrobium bathyomarinum]|jgi:hypothetical protein|uniref:hypothetical protein n=2 Tax=Alphaproteobacteria TaxID=28211 RepID=UPI002694A2DF|tara:strand:- start:10446 stop:11165 length:720 start_codon:yes stop_codon:yes gene_type:complete